MTPRHDRTPQLPLCQPVSHILHSGMLPLSLMPLDSDSGANHGFLDSRDVSIDASTVVNPSNSREPRLIHRGMAPLSASYPVKARAAYHVLTVSRLR